MSFACAGWVPSTDIGAGIEAWMEKNAPQAKRTTIPESAKGCVKLFEELTIKDTVSFFNYDGSKLPW